MSRGKGQHNRARQAQERRTARWRRRMGWRQTVEQILCADGRISTVTTTRMGDWYEDVLYAGSVPLDNFPGPGDLATITPNPAREW